MVIDCHAHWIPPEVADSLRQRRAAPRIAHTPDGERFFTYQGNRRFDAALGDLNVRRSLMRRHGIATQLLSLAGLFGIDCLPVEESAPLVRAFNNAVIEAQRAFPDEFAGLAALPLADIGRACSELERVCAEGIRGAILPADGFRTVSEAARFIPLFDLGERVRCHFFVHPGPIEPVPEVQLRDLRDDSAWQRRIVLATQARLSEVMTTLNFSGYLDSYPNVTVQVANLGGTIPFLLERMDEVAREQPGDDAPPSMRTRRCYVDTASFGPRAIEMAVACYGADRVMLGTDCPIFDSARMMQSLAEARLDTKTRERVCFRNAYEMLVGDRKPLTFHLAANIPLTNAEPRGTSRKF
ncbi:MAG: amidohydrolase [Betaproteobacteria bacterium]|nr:amidohydrolase [Betaproteobacteria bacterium]MBI3054244.1 amidohydrolase [Betaproteobacteria bacterium]